MVAAILRYIVASPRNPYYTDNGLQSLDLAYITPRIIVSSMPTSEYIRSWYRTPAGELKRFLESRHGSNWKIWNLRAEISGEYDDKVFDYRVERFPFPDHNPPPFALLISAVESLSKFLGSDDRNVAVIHCKAGQGRSGTISCAYLMVCCNATSQQAIDLFTDKRMRPGFGPGVSIASQRRYLDYVGQWLDNGKRYESNTIVKLDSIVLTDCKYADLNVQVAGFTHSGRKIDVKYTFSPGHRAGDLILTLPTHTKLYLGPDVQVSVWHSKGPGRFVTHSTAHVWFNVYFELQKGQSSFTAQWEDLDGFIGTAKRGSKAFTTLLVNWTTVES
uniref:phosphatidylinositol-3,4,5-trisphosphate 3-phosphatase n=1 Tax=Blastobotrys adeninivorans TaxID=409370 RepID=A0A060TAK7_BLAAD